MSSNSNLIDLKKNYEKWHNGSVSISRFDQKYYGWILNHLSENGGLLLDVACGKGAYLEIAARKGFQVLGIDISIKAIRTAKKTSNLLFINGVGESLPFQNNSIDNVTCLGSLEHFIYPNLGVKEIARVLKHKGLALILVPNLFFAGHIYLAWKYGFSPSEGGQDFSEHFMTLQGWKNLIESNGLEIVRISNWNRISSASKKVGVLTRYFYDLFLRHLMPFNLSYEFLFLCQKQKQERNK